MRLQRDGHGPGVVFLLAVAAISALAGCYTVLKHPPNADVAEGTGGESRRDCFDCHSETGPAHLYDPMIAPAYSYLDDQWYPWYAYPWWYRNFWYSDRHEHAGYHGDGIPSRRDNNDRERTIWGRGPSLIPVPPVAPVISGGTSTGGGSGGSGTQPSGEKDNKDTGRTMKSGQTTSGDQGKKDADKDKKENKKEEGRNVWKRGGGK